MSWYVLVSSSTEGMALYQTLRQQNLGVRIAPAPRGETTCCGMSILIDEGQEPAVRSAIEAGGLAHDRIVEVATNFNPHRDKYC